MNETDAEAVTRRVQQTLNAASYAVSQKKDWTERVRSNWASGETSVEDLKRLKNNLLVAGM